MRYLKTKKVSKQFTVLVDDREKKAWNLPYKIEKKRLKTGDYTISDFEDIIAIEKKSGLIELLNDLANGYRPTFERFLKRLSMYPVKVIIVEDTLSELSINRALIHIRKKSRGKARLTSRTIYYWVAEIATKYGIPIIFVGKRAKLDLLPEIFRAAFECANKL
jgi:ERCC4-type nuclease